MKIVDEQVHRLLLPAVSVSSPSGMEQEKASHMNDPIIGYCTNSSLQRRDQEIVKHLIQRAVVDAFVEVQPSCMNMADLGCSSGPNSLQSTASKIEAVNEICSRKSIQPPEFMVFFNDLPSNDFNSLFMGMPNFMGELVGETRARVFMAGVPGSFYSRLFPSNSLHFVHSSYSLHWLSRVPNSLVTEEGESVNKGKTYLTKESPLSVQEAYSQQFQEDFALFLGLRSQELVPGGRMALVVLGRRTRDHSDKAATLLWDLLDESFAALVHQREVGEEEVDLYNTHFYSPSLEEIQVEVEREGSFTIECLEIFEGKSSEKDQIGAKTISLSIRAIQEPILRQHFREVVIDKLFSLYKDMVQRELMCQDIKSINIIAVLRKIPL